MTSKELVGALSAQYKTFPMPAGRTQTIMNHVPEEMEKDEMLFVIRSTVRDMKSPCSEILDLSVYQEKKQEEIARIMQYANADVVKTQKARCMKGLRVKVRERLKMMGHEV